jgi:hypothetical protein
MPPLKNKNPTHMMSVPVTINALLLGLNESHYFVARSFNPMYCSCIGLS